MSSTLVWRPVIEQKSNYLSDELKFILREHYDLPYEFSSNELQFLKGLNAAKVKGVSQLIEAIENHSRVEVREEY